MSKYIIDIPDNVKKIVCLHLGNANAVWTTSNDLDDLEQLNSDYINEHFGDLQDTAYQKGINDGSLDVKQRVEGAYQKGLDEAWKAARRISVIELNGGLAGKELMKIYGTMDIHKIYDDNTASEAIEKLKAYEEKQKAEDKIKVGDEVNWLGDCFVVTRIFQPRNMKEQCDGIDDDGCVYHDVLIKDLEKTGRHFDIQKILEGMK